jgi:beta-galactosidase
MKKILLVCLALVFLAPQGFPAQSARHTFTLEEKDFLLDGKPFRIISGELHPARIPREYWRHRIQMVKAMGCNTIATYVFWNYHESEPGSFDFENGNHEISEFFRLVQQEGMWVLLRPGPYVCAEWEFGGLPPYLLRIPDIKLRCLDLRYMAAVDRYLTRLAGIVAPLQISQGGPILMVQLENEYGSYGNDKGYILALKNIWLRNKIDVPFYTADGATPHMLEAGTVEGAAIGLDPGAGDGDFEEALKRTPRVPVFSSETYPGWLTHWGEKWARPGLPELLKEVTYLLENHKSFNLYVAHGGTNFGFTAGANSGGKGYEPDLTSYDYDAPINEQGQPTSKYFALRDLIAKYAGKLPDVPRPIAAMEIPPIKMEVAASLWTNLPVPVQSPQPLSFEACQQDYGFILYKTRLIGHKSGKLTITSLHDYGTVFLNGKYVGKLDRREGENSLELPKSDAPNPVLEILVEAMGRINFGPELIDRKGITDRVTLNNMTLMNWDLYKLPLDTGFLEHLKPGVLENGRCGAFFRGSFELASVADTFINLARYKKGLVWINGHNLGRYWGIGPQQRLYCPASWLKKGKNEILIFDLHQTDPQPVSGMKTLE